MWIVHRGDTCGLFRNYPTSKTIHMLYTTPAHQFPLGMIMTMERRAALLQWANLNEALIIEDDYDSEFRYKGLPIPL